MWCGGFTMGRCRRDVASSPRLRFSPPEVFAQRLLQPVSSCIFFRQLACPALGFVAVTRHRGPVSNASRLKPLSSGYIGFRLRMVQSPIPAFGRDFVDTAHRAVDFRKFCLSPAPLTAGSPCPPQDLPPKSGAGSAPIAAHEGYLPLPAPILAVFVVQRAVRALARAGALWQGSARL
jgi:hypothetical protein